jgi:hypothetical protein
VQYVITNVVHCGGVSGPHVCNNFPARVFEVNVHGTLNLFEVVRQRVGHVASLPFEPVWLQLVEGRTLLFSRSRFEPTRNFRIQNVENDLSTSVEEIAPVQDSATMKLLGSTNCHIFDFDARNCRLPRTDLPSSGNAHIVLDWCK